MVDLKVNDPPSVANTIEMLNAHPYVVSAEPNFYLESHIIPNDQYFDYLWGLQEIDCPSAWNYTTGNPDIVVGITDSGINYSHPDIQANMWLTPGEQGVRGWNFEDNNDNVMDYTDHGTHVAGTVGAVGNNFIGVAGVCWNVKLAALKIGNVIFDLAAAINAIDYANRYRIPILNNSWGSRFFSVSLKHAIDNYDGLFIASAGNNGTDNDVIPMYPASYDSKNIISVAATDPNNTLSSFSNYGATSVDIAAPGRDILSTSLYEQYSYMNGTSMAAPHVAGAAALLKGYRPELTTLEIKDIILSSVEKKAQLFGKVSTGGIINIGRMLESIS